MTVGAGWQELGGGKGKEAERWEVRVSRILGEVSFSVALKKKKNPAQIVKCVIQDRITLLSFCITRVLSEDF